MEVGGLWSRTAYENGAPLVKIGSEDVHDSYVLYYDTSFSTGDMLDIGQPLDDKTYFDVTIYGNPSKKYVYGIEIGGEQYVTKRGELIEAIKNFDTWFDVHKNKNCVVFKQTRSMASDGNQDSFCFYKNVFSPETYSGDKVEHTVSYDNEYIETIKVNKRYTPTTFHWPVTPTQTHKPADELNISEYKNDEDYTYCFDKNGDEYATISGPQICFDPGEVWKIDSATGNSIIFSFSSHRVEFCLMGWSGKGYDPGDSQKSF